MGMKWEYMKREFESGSHSSEFHKAVCHVLEMMQCKDPELYKQSMLCFYKALYGEHFCEELAKEAVEGFMNCDGSKGPKWTLSQTQSLMMSQRANAALYNEFDFYFVMNMLWSDHSDILGSDPNLYAKMAVSWLEDKDVAEGKAFRYYFKVAKGE